MNALECFNAMPEAEVEAGLLRCCGATRWAAAMRARRPFPDEAALRRMGAALWRGLTPEDWREAFATHPRIGDVESLKARFSTTRTWATSEQAGVGEADAQVLKALAEGNRAYEARFGYIFIVCATGKSAAEMLALLRERLHNDPGDELIIAAAEQEKILLLRLEKWLRELNQT